MWFERAYDHRDARLVNLGIDLPQLRDDARFRALQRKMGLP